VVAAFTRDEQILASEDLEAVFRRSDGSRIHVGGTAAREPS
jgi:hypothetical protein